MALSKELTDLVLQFDAATDEVASDLQALRDRVKTSMTQVEVDKLKADITQRVDRLNALGQDPADPVPDAPGNTGTPGNTNDPNSPNFSGNRGNR